jgi:transcriptional regulator EpsA
MDTLQARLPRWLGASAIAAPPLAQTASRSGWGGEAGAALEFTAEESTQFGRLVSECARIRRHYDIYRWLGTEVQHFLPHDILLTAWGDFGSGELKLDLASGLPGMRTAQIAHCRVDNLVRQAYGRWIDAGRKAVLLKPADTEAVQHACLCPIHEGLRRMRGMLVHGVHDKRSGHDSLFIALTSGSFTKGRSVQRFLAFVDPLVAQIDAAFRKVPALALADARRTANDGANPLDLSAREMEVLESICRGKTNLEIAAILDISPFTVKNHVQRIFRKIGVTNRTQAAARYSEAVRQAASAPAGLVAKALDQTA